MTPRFLFLVLLAFACVRGSSLRGSRKTRNVFYVLGTDGVYVIDPVARRLVTKITNTTSPGLCAPIPSDRRRVFRRPCNLHRASAVDDLVFISDGSGSALRVIDVDLQKKIETVTTDPNPYGLYYLPWRNELWVHSWTNSTFDVIHTKTRTRTHNAVRAHIKPGWTHGLMVSHEAVLQGTSAYVTHMWNAGIHKVNLESKSYSDFLNFTKQGCTGTYGIAYNILNQHLFVQCMKTRRPGSLIEVNVANDVVVKTWDIPGRPFVSPNGRYVLALYRSKNSSIMTVLAVKGSEVQKYPELRIPGGVSRVVFYPKDKSPGSYYAFVTLDYSNKMAVVDLDLAKNGNVSDVKYIEEVGELDTTLHAASRDLFLAGKYIVSPATKSKTVVIIDAEAQKVHGKIDNVNGGNFAVWVGDEVKNGYSYSGAQSFLIIGALNFLYALDILKL